MTTPPIRDAIGRLTGEVMRQRGELSVVFWTVICSELIATAIVSGIIIYFLAWR